MARIELRERGIYALPDGKEYVVCAVKGGGFNLYDPEGWNFLSLAVYRAHEDGRLYRNLSPSSWGLDDLLDTGRTADFLQTPDA